MLDLEAAALLMARQNLVDFGEAQVSTESLLAAWQAPGFSLSQNTWVVEDPQGELAGYAELVPGGRFPLCLFI